MYPRQHNYSLKKGFTIIELMLAMTFVSFLLVGVALLTIQMSHIYTRGLTMKEINQAGTEVSDDIRQSIREASASKVKTATKVGYRVLCTGTYSYIANNPAGIASGSTSNAKISGVPVRLAKVRDVASAYCGATSPSLALPSDSVELLGAGDRSLVVRQMTLDSQSPLLTNDLNSGRAMFTVRLTLSTGIDTELDANGCIPPASPQSGEEYCAIDTFVIVARVGNV